MASPCQISFRVWCCKVPQRDAVHRRSSLHGTTKIPIPQHGDRCPGLLAHNGSLMRVRSEPQVVNGLFRAVPGDIGFPP